MSKLADLVPARAVDYCERHPKIFVFATAALVAFSLYNLVDSIELYHKARELAGELQREASEALGG